MHKKTSTIIGLAIATILTASALTMSNQAFAQQSGMSSHAEGFSALPPPVPIAPPGSGLQIPTTLVAGAHTLAGHEAQLGKVLAGHESQLGEGGLGTFCEHHAGNQECYNRYHAKQLG
jgi:hypothetical protein